MTPPFWTERKCPRESGKRFAAAILVTIAHMLVVAALIKATHAVLPTHRAQRATEIWFVFPPKRDKEPNSDRAAKSAKKKPQAISPAAIIPDYGHFALPPSWSRIDANGLNQTLFGCDLSGRALLNDRQRAKCPPSVRARPEDGRLVLKPPPDGTLRLTPAERRLRELQTADPCLVEKSAHLPFCIHNIIYGDALP